MKRFELWLTTVIMFSLPALVFAQATGGSTDSKVIKNGKALGTGRKGSVQPEIRKKGTGNAPKTAGTTPPPKVETPAAGKGYRKGSGTGRKGRVEQTDGGKKVIKGTDKGKKPAQ